MNVPIGNDSDWTKDHAPGDDLFVAEYSSDTDEVTVKEYVVVTKYGRAATIDGVDDDAVLCDLKDKKFKSTLIKKQDVTHGFKKTPLEAVQELATVIDSVHAATHRKLDEFSR